MFFCETEPDRIRPSPLPKPAPSSSAPGRLLDHRHVDVDLVGRALHRRRLDVDLGEVAEPVDAAACESAIFSREYHAAFELAHLAPDHFVARAGVARDVDAAHVDAAAGIDEERERDLLLLLVELGHGVDVGERIAVVAEAVADELGRFGQRGRARTRRPA